jgi:hypothetical protein
LQDPDSGERAIVGARTEAGKAAEASYEGLRKAGLPEE